MKKIFTALAIMLFLPNIVIAGNPQAHIEEVASNFKAAFNAGDAAKIAGFYSEDAALLPPGADRVDGRPAIQTFWQGAIDAGMTMVDLSTIEVHARNDMAAEVGAFILRVPGDSGTTDVEGQYIVIWKRDGHTWQLYRDVWNTK